MVLNEYLDEIQFRLETSILLDVTFTANLCI